MKVVKHDETERMCRELHCLTSLKQPKRIGARRATVTQDRNIELAQEIDMATPFSDASNSLPENSVATSAKCTGAPSRILTRRATVATDIPFRDGDINCFQNESFDFLGTNNTESQQENNRATNSQARTIKFPQEIDMATPSSDALIALLSENLDPVRRAADIINSQNESGTSISESLQENNRHKSTAKDEPVDLSAKNQQMPEAHKAVRSSIPLMDKTNRLPSIDPRNVPNTLRPLAAYASVSNYMRPVPYVPRRFNPWPMTSLSHLPEATTYDEGIVDQNASENLLSRANANDPMIQNTNQVPQLDVDPLGWVEYPGVV